MSSGMAQIISTMFQNLRI